MCERKYSEDCALKILSSLGIQMNLNYYDNNSKESMPDLQYICGRYVEVTHTLHNNRLKMGYEGLTNYQKAQLNDNSKDHFRKLCREEEKIGNALDRVFSMDYERNGLSFTEKGIQQYRDDCKFLKERKGYDLTETDLEKRYSEFNCDCPTIVHSPYNILREITKDKGPKHSSGNTDLFVFVTEDEFRLLKEFVSEWRWNRSASGYLQQILDSPFPTIYICEWDFDNQKYNTTNPRIVMFIKEKVSSSEKERVQLKWRWFNE